MDIKKRYANVASIGALLFTSTLLFFILCFPHQLKAQEFSSPKTIQEGCSACKPQTTRIADLDNDGDQDLLVGSDFPYIGWFENTGTGFSEFKIINKDNGEELTVGDFNGDGAIDFGKPEYEQNTTSAYMYANSGNGTFDKENFDNDLGDLTTVVDEYLAAGDINGDNKQDLLALIRKGYTAYELSYFTGGEVGSISPKMIDTYEGQTTKVTLSDVDADGDLDIFKMQSNSLGWYENIGGGEFSEEKIILTPESGRISTFYTSDLDGDGDKDLLTQEQANYVGTLSLFEYNSEEGTFNDKKKLLEGTGATARPIDLDGDEDKDIVTVKPYEPNNGIIWIENEGDASFKTPAILSNEDPDKLYLSLSIDNFLRVGDLNGDSRKDILYNGVYGLGLKQFKWFPNIENGALGASRTIGKQIPLQTFGDLSGADISQNGYKDLLVQSNSASKSFAGFFSNSGDDLTYEHPILERPIDESLLNIKFGKIDDDQYPDALYNYKLRRSDGQPPQSILQWSENSGNGTFSSPQTISEEMNSLPIKMADVDGDSDQEILATNYYKSGPRYLVVFPNNNGTIGDQSIRIEIGGIIKDIEFADLDGDGIKDLVLNSPSGWGGDDTPPAVVWYKNNIDEWDFSAGTHGLSGPNIYKAPSVPNDRSLAFNIDVADVDNDGDNDILNQNRWFENTDGKGTLSKPLEIGGELKKNQPAKFGATIADLDEDGDPDIISQKVLYEGYTDQMLWYENQGGTFSSGKKLISGVDRLNNVYSFDINRDGVQDIVYRSRQYKRIAWFENTGIRVSENSMSGGETASFGATSARMELSEKTTGSGKVIVSKGQRRPVGNEGINADYTAGIRMVVRSEGDLEIGSESRIYFDLNKLPSLNDPQNASIFKRDTVDRGTFQELQTTYENETNELSAAIDTTGEIVFANKYPPVAQADTFSVGEDDTLKTTAPGIIKNDKNPLGKKLEISLISKVTDGELTVNNDGSFQYIPEAEFDSTDSFTYQISDGFSTSKTKVTINVETQNINLAVGGGKEWQLVAFPIASSRKYEVFPENQYNWTLFKFDHFYKSASTVEPGHGYWLKSGDGSEAIVQQDGKGTLRIELDSGWNLIGGINQAVALTDVIDESDILMERTLFGFNDGYYDADTIRVGNGYWLRAENSGIIKLSDDLSGNNTAPKVAGFNGPSRTKAGAKSEEITEQFNKLIVGSPDSREVKLYMGGALPDGVDKTAFSLPPKPPSESFDARFNGGYRLTTEDSPRLKLQGYNAPVEISLETPTGINQQKYNVEVVTDDNSYESQVLTTGSSIRVYQEDIDYLRFSEVSSQDTEIPEKFHLNQNYPNPFNPSTTIKFGVPEAAIVKITVYDILGRRVKTLADKKMKAGWHTVKFNADRMASGVYFYRLKTTNWSKTHKLLLLK